MQNPTPLLILTPLPLELEALVSYFGNKPEPQLFSSTKVIWVQIQEERVAFAVGGHGKVDFALTTQHLIRELRPRLVIAAGSAGALQPQIQPGDIVVAEKIVEHDHLVKFFSKPLPHFAGNASTIKQLKARPGHTDFTVHFGVIASGDEDVIEPTRASDIQTRTKALAVAWEGAGLARACRRTNTPFVEMRAITDLASSTTSKDFAVNLKSAMTHLGQVIGSII